MQLRLFHNLRRSHPPATLTIGTDSVPVVFVRNPRARRYILRVDAGTTVRVTVPARGSQAEAWHFLRRNTAWIQRRIAQHWAQPQPPPAVWGAGTPVLFRGLPAQLSIITHPSHQLVEFADQRLTVGSNVDIRRAVERHLWDLARPELAARTAELAIKQSLKIERVTVRNQRSRWGSCSRRGTISLNWRLIQAPAPVRDYVILHELMHRHEPNHSDRFWARVAAVCPDYAVAERWLKQHRPLLR